MAVAGQRAAGAYLYYGAVRAAWDAARVGQEKDGAFPENPKTKKKLLPFFRRSLFSLFISKPLYIFFTSGYTRKYVNTMHVLKFSIKELKRKVRKVTKCPETLAALRKTVPTFRF